jgi:hypothetical protein
VEEVAQYLSKEEMVKMKKRGSCCNDILLINVGFFLYIFLLFFGVKGRGNIDYEQTNLLQKSLAIDYEQTNLLQKNPASFYICFFLYIFLKVYIIVVFGLG